MRLNIVKITRLLAQRYLDFDHYNKKNPLNELIFVLFSVMKSEPVYTRTYRNFKKSFPRYTDILNASIQDIAKSIYHGGQSMQKATAIQSITSILAERFGRPTLAPLKNMLDNECEVFLTSLPRVGKKVARCVMLYSLGRKVFPIDIHCRRIAIRLGWINATKFNEDALQDMIPEELRFSLHVNLISLGREFCTARSPVCRLCPLTGICRKIGVAQDCIPNTSKPKVSRICATT